MKNCAVIPARIGSKRIKNKNIKIFINKPIIIKILEKIFESKLFDEVFVSTDSKDVADLVFKYNPKIVLDMRPSYLSGDDVSTNEVVNHVIERYKLKEDVVYCIYPTAILMEPADLVKGRDEFGSEKFNMIYCAAKFQSSPYRAILKKKNKIRPLFKKYIKFRSQDLNDLFYDVGFYYISRGNSWLKGISISDRTSSFVEIPNHRAIDINNYADWDLAEILYKNIWGNL